MEIGLTENKYVKHTFTDAEIMSLSRKMANAIKVISEKEDMLASFRDTIRAEITEQQGIINKCSEGIRSGYEMVQKECHLRYIVEKSEVVFLDKETGEILDKRPMTEDEQLKLSGIEKPNEGGDTIEE